MYYAGASVKCIRGIQVSRPIGIAGTAPHLGAVAIRYNIHRGAVLLYTPTCEGLNAAAAHLRNAHREYIRSPPLADTPYTIHGVQAVLIVERKKKIHSIAPYRLG